MGIHPHRTKLPPGEAVITIALVSDTLLPTGSPTPNAEPPAVSTPGPDSGEAVPLSRVILRRTTDLIAISLVLIAGLTIARRVSVWWETEPTVATAFPHEALTPWGSGPGGALVGLGDRPLMLRRQIVSGNLDAALRQVQANCRRVLESPSGSHAPLLPITPTEADLLSKMDRIPVLEEDRAAGWSLHRLSGPLSMILGVGRQHSAGSGERDADEQRVLCWGLVFPSAESTWTVLTVEPRAAEGASTWDLPLPEGTQARMRMSDDIGGGVLTFSGNGPPTAWQHHWDREAARRGWRTLRDWESGSDGWTAAWQADIHPEKNGHPPETGRGGSRRIDVQFLWTEQGWSGFVHVSPGQN